MRNIRVILLLD